MADLIPVDAEQLVVDFLLGDAAVAAMVGRDVYTELPVSHGWPAVRVHQFFDEDIAQLWLIRSSLQVDVWGLPKTTTRLIADTIRFALKWRLPGSQPRGVVTLTRLGGLDTTADPAQPPTAGKSRPRCRFSLDVWAHPSPALV